MYYFGYNKKVETVIVFRSETKPTKESYKEYDAIFGGYRTREIATQKANTQFNCHAMQDDKRKKWYTY